MFLSFPLDLKKWQKCHYKITLLDLYTDIIYVRAQRSEERTKLHEAKK